MIWSAISHQLTISRSDLIPRTILASIKSWSWWMILLTTWIGVWSGSEISSQQLVILSVMIYVMIQLAINWGVFSRSNEPIMIGICGMQSADLYHRIVSEPIASRSFLESGPHHDPSDPACYMNRCKIRNFITIIGSFISNIAIFKTCTGWETSSRPLANASENLAGRVENRPGQVEFCIGYIRDCPVRASAKKI